MAPALEVAVHRAHGTRVRHFGHYCGLLARLIGSMRA